MKRVLDMGINMDVETDTDLGRDMDMDMDIQQFGCRMSDIGKTFNLISVIMLDSTLFSLISDTKSDIVHYRYRPELPTYAYIHVF
jgi:hypothetical protein